MGLSARSNFLKFRKTIWSPPVCTHTHTVSNTNLILHFNYSYWKINYSVFSNIGTKQIIRRNQLIKSGFCSPSAKQSIANYHMKWQKFLEQYRNKMGIMQALFIVSQLTLQPAISACSLLLVLRQSSHVAVLFFTLQPVMLSLQRALMHAFTAHRSFSSFLFSHKFRSFLGNYLFSVLLR